MSLPSERNIDAFNADARERGGYLYSTNAPLSARLAHERYTQAILSLCDFQGKNVIDIGCGDGVFTLELATRGNPASLVACDPAVEALELAAKKSTGSNITFAAASAYDLPYADKQFDIAHLRAVLHHMDHPVDALREGLRVAKEIVVLEPNGYSPVLKFNERFSSYHIQHDEKSYAPAKLDAWVRSVGGEVVSRCWVGLVPTFAPDWFAKSLKVVEPIVEKIPVLRSVACGVYVFVARRLEP